MAIKATVVLAIFALIFLSNLWYKTTDLQNAKKIKITLEPAILELYEKQTNQYSMYLGCVPEEFGVGSYAMWLSAFLFVFLSLLLFKPSKQYFYLLPMLVIVWISLSELIIRIYEIPVLHSVPMEGDQQTLPGLYFQFSRDIELEIVFIFFASIITGAIAYSASKEIRKFIKSRSQTRLT